MASPVIGLNPVANAHGEQKRFVPWLLAARHKVSILKPLLLSMGLLKNASPALFFEIAVDYMI